MITLEKLAATRFLMELGTGSTKPCVFSCVSLDGEIAGEHVVKFRSTVRGGGNGLCFEFLAAQLAALLGIPMPKPALVELDRDLLESTEETAVRERIGRSLGLNFGTEYKTPGYSTWLTGDTIPASIAASCG